MSILIDFDPDDNDNTHFQEAIDEWQKVFNANALKCKLLNQNQRRRLSTDDEVIPSFSEAMLNATHSDLYDATPRRDEAFTRMPPLEAVNASNRNLVEKAFGRGGWDPFHPSLERVSPLVIAHVCHLSNSLTQRCLNCISPIY